MMRHLTAWIIAAGTVGLAYGLAGRAIAQEPKSRRVQPPVTARPEKRGILIRPEAISPKLRVAIPGQFGMPIVRKDPSLYSMVIVPHDTSRYRIRVLPPQGTAEVLPTPPPQVIPAEPLLLEPVNGRLSAPDPQEVSSRAQLLLKEIGDSNRLQSGK